MQMTGERKDIVDMKCLKNESGEVLVEADAVKERWREYMLSLPLSLLPHILSASLLLDLLWPSATL